MPSLVGSEMCIRDSVYIVNPQDSTHYYPIYDSDPAARDSDGDGVVGPEWSCNRLYGTQPADYQGATCNLTSLGFNTSSFTVYVRGGNKIVTDVFYVNYTWCWQPAKPQMRNMVVRSANTTLKTGGWGEVWNFTVEVMDPQGDDVNVSAWYNDTASDDVIHTYVGSEMCYSCSDAPAPQNT